jgi:hypothetical protein
MENFTPSFSFLAFMIKDACSLVLAHPKVFEQMSRREFVLFLLVQQQGDLLRMHKGNP